MRSPHQFSRPRTRTARSNHIRNRAYRPLFLPLLSYRLHLSNLRPMSHDETDHAVNPDWLGDLDSNQGCSVQSREFYR